ncbi:MAG: DUF1697 domain-containing protein [Coprobacillus sp.]|nr:DUF1697 domain-containing protein [Coprobacillus sp.]
MRRYIAFLRGININGYKCQSKNVQICSLKNVQFYN